jgi:hypothetical protein
MSAQNPHLDLVDIRGFNSIIHSTSCGYPLIQHQNPLIILWISLDSTTKSIYHLVDTVSKIPISLFCTPFHTFHLIIDLNLLKKKKKKTSPILWVSKQAN